MMILPAAHRPLTVSKGGRTCYAFQWVGQPFSGCDNCGHPYWKHSHYLGARMEPGAPFARRFRKIITVDEAIGCYMKWGS